MANDNLTNSQAIPWHWPTPVDPGIEAEWAHALGGAPPAIARALAARGTPTPEQWRGEPLSRALDRVGIPDEVDAAARVLAGLAKKGPIGILCDYDVDGGSSQAIMIEALSMLRPGDRIAVAVPERNREGFGPNERCLRELSECGAKAVVVLDCGSSAGELLDGFDRDHGLHPVVIDHHRAPEHLRPDRGLRVNPHLRAEGARAHAHLCTGALALLVASAIADHAITDRARVGALKRRWLAFAALATVCDMMTLDPVNRAIVRAGALSIRDPASRPIGIAALAAKAGIDPARLVTADLGWRIGPRLNAGSRMGESALAAACLRATCEAEAAEIAARLDQHNTRRRHDSDTLARNLVRAGEGPLDFAAGPVSVAVAPASHPGVAGLGASALVKAFGWPAVVLAPEPDGGNAEEARYAGSGRSALGMDLGAAVERAVESGVLSRGGGHAAACGMTMVTPPGREAAREAVAALRAFLAAEARSQGLAPRERRIDATLHALDVEPGALAAIVEHLDRLAPFGNGAPKPVFGIRSSWIREVRRTRSGGHLIGTLDVENTPADFVWWRPPEDAPERMGIARTALAEPGESAAGGPSARLDAVVRANASEFRGKVNHRLVIDAARRTV